MVDRPLVTIITPAYNCARFIAETVESVLGQDYENIEYIVLEDGSTDGTSAILAEYDNIVDMHNAKVVSKAASDLIETFNKPMNTEKMLMMGIGITFLAFSGRDTLCFDVIRHANIGEQKTVNEGLSMVKGKYFMIVNADDPLLPGAVGQLLKFMEAHPDVLCAYPDWKSINEDGSFRTHIKSREYDFTYMVRHHTCLPSVGSMFRSSVLEKVPSRDTSFHWLGDFDFWLRIGLAGVMARVPMELATWRHRDGQASQVKSDWRAREHIKIIKKFYSLPNIPIEILRVKREAICWSYIVAASVAKSKKDIAKYAFKAVSVYPESLLSFEFYDAFVKRATHILRR